MAALLAIDLSTTSGQSINGKTLWGRDFANVYSAGRILAEGKLAILYDVPAYQAWQSAHFGPGIAEHNYSYPPVTLLYAWAWGAFPYPFALALWSGASLGAFALAARPCLERAGQPAWLALVLPSTLLCVWAGHYGLFLGALWLFAFANLDRRPVRSGMAIGAMIVKPHLALLLPLVLIRRGHWRVVAAAAITVASLVAASLIAFGGASWRTFLTSTSSTQLALVSHADDYFGLMMPGVATALFGLGATAALAWTVQAIVSLLTILLLWFKLPDDPMQAGAATAAATFLVLPYAFNYDMTVVGLAALLAITSAVVRRDNLALLITAAALAISPLMIFLNLLDLRIAPLLVAALLWLLLRRPLFTGAQRTSPPNAQRRLPAAP
jgi:hypothetical protein